MTHKMRLNERGVTSVCSQVCMTLRITVNTYFNPGKMITKRETSPLSLHTNPHSSLNQSVA